MKDDHKKPLVIHIDKKRYRAPKEVMTGAELKTLGGVQPGFMLFHMVPGPDPDQPIGDDEAVHLRNGDHFYTLPPGVVGIALPSVEAELVEVREAFPDVSVAQTGNGFNIELPAVGLPKHRGWDQKETRVMLPVPANYPASRPPNFFIDPSLSRNGQIPGGRGGPVSIAGRQWCPLCWSPKTDSRNSLLGCLRFALSRFEVEQ